MRKHTSGKGADVMQVELKYCERCGGLWLRECGDQQVYCASCIPRVAELPASSKQLSLAKLPAGPNVDLEGCGFDIRGVDGGLDLNAAGGVA